VARILATVACSVSGTQHQWRAATGSCVADSTESPVQDIVARILATVACSISGVQLPGLV
jgi:hypothetical protein